jgi:hypothetical protein
MENIEIVFEIGMRSEFVKRNFDYRMESNPRSGDSSPGEYATRSEQTVANSR